MDDSPAECKNSGSILDPDFPSLIEAATRHGAVIFGAGLIGKAAIISLRECGVMADLIVADNDEKKHSSSLLGVPIRAPAELTGVSAETPVVVATVYVRQVIRQLQELGFKRFYPCSGLLDCLPAPFIAALNWSERRSVELYSFTLDSLAHPEGLYLKSVDVVLTERCTLRCRDCANLMQYYDKPVSCSHPLILSSIEHLMMVVDRLFEFRLLGGEPLMDKAMHEVLVPLTQYDKTDGIVIYTNGTLVPQGANLAALKHPKIHLEVTDYGPLSRNLTPLLQALDQHAIDYKLVRFEKWQDCGDIEPRGAPSDALARKYANCCAADTYTLLHGVLYPCPFAAHAVNLGAIPKDVSEQVNLGRKPVSKSRLREALQQFIARRHPHSACVFCGGRDFGHATIPAAIQSPSPRPYQKFV